MTPPKNLRHTNDDMTREIVRRGGLIKWGFIVGFVIGLVLGTIMGSFVGVVI